MDQLAATQFAVTVPILTGKPQTCWVPQTTDSAHPTASAAYFRAQARGFGPGAEMHDWLLVIDEISHQQR